MTSSCLHAHAPSAPPLSAASRMEALSWRSDVLAHTMEVEHGAVGIDTDRVVYIVKLSLAKPLPATLLLHTKYLCLTWPVGGLWKIERIEDEGHTVHIESWRRTTMSRADLAKLKEEHEAKLAAGEDIGTLFEWKMMRGIWGNDEHHWFLRSIDPPVEVPPEERTLVAKLFAGFSPLEAQIEVNAITSVDTVAQTFNADVTWQVTIPGITAIREDSVLRELLDILEFDAEEFEFTNVNSMQEERPLASSVTPAGEAQFRDLTLQDEDLTTEIVYHLQYSRRVIATFSEEMTLHNFPFDQQKLTFDFSTGSGMPEGPIRLSPTPVDPGSFAIENFRLGNVFHVVCHNKVFVSDVHESGPKKSITFELLLERRSGYYLTNVALIAAFITYLCFITYAPVDGDTLMDVSSRLQIVLTLLLTAVTFKNQVASLIPQVSYFTSLDKYVFFCFIVTCVVTIENALFPLWAQIFASAGVWKENSLLGISLAGFTLVNLAWGYYLKRWVDQRRHLITVLLEVHEYIRVITENFPAEARDAVLQEFFVERKYDEHTRPQIHVTPEGDLHIQLPGDAPSNEKTLHKKLHAVQSQKQRALTELSSFNRIYERLYPGAPSRAVAPQPGHVIKAIRPNAAYEAAETRGRRASSAVSLSNRTLLETPLRPSYEDTTVTLEPYHRHSAGSRPRVF